MFDVGAGELIVIFIIVIVFLGPKRIPDIAKALGNALREFNRAKDQIKDGIMHETHRDEVEEIKKAFQAKDGGSSGKKSEPSSPQSP